VADLYFWLIVQSDYKKDGRKDYSVAQLAFKVITKTSLSGAQLALDHFMLLIK
jgi:hypothetical protein